VNWKEDICQWSKTKSHRLLCETWYSYLPSNIYPTVVCKQWLMSVLIMINAIMQTWKWGCGNCLFVVVAPTEKPHLSCEACSPGTQTHVQGCQCRQCHHVDLLRVFFRVPLITKTNHPKSCWLRITAKNIRDLLFLTNSIAYCNELVSQNVV